MGSRAGLISTADEPSAVGDVWSGRAGTPGTRLRRLLMMAFSPAAITRPAPQREEIVDGTLDGLADRDVPSFEALADAAIRSLTWTGDPDATSSPPTTAL